MIDLTTCAIEQLQVHPEFTLYRARPREAEHSWLVLVPRRPSARALAKLENEFALAPRLNAAWAVRPAELVPHKESMMLVLEDPGGSPLPRLLEQPLPLHAQLRLSVSLAEAVAQVHRQGLLHRDIRPGNALVVERESVRLTGFGNALHRTQDDEFGDLIVGTLPYLAPERTGQLDRPVDSRSDLYALGVTLYEIFAGSLPFSASEPEEWIHCHVARTPLSPSEKVPLLPAQVSEIVLKLLSKEPGDRYRTAEGVAADLKKCLAEWTARQSVEGFALDGSEANVALKIPPMLYGRSRELAALCSALEHADPAGETLVALVSGASGVGKSSLVRSFQTGLASRNALIATGKFDMQARGIPYAALSQAFGKLVRQILTFDEEEVAAWRHRVADAVGLNGHLAVGLIPDLVHLLGPQPLPSNVAPQDRANRLRIVFRELLRAFARPAHPLVLFLDDLHWLDDATLEIVSHLVIRRDVPDLMLVGAYRTEELGPHHPLALQLERIRGTGVPMTEIDLRPLLAEDTATLVADTLARKPAHVRALAELIHKKTGGNPLFATRFLRTLHEEGLLEYDHRSGAWRWDIGRVRAQRFTDNLADLMATTLDLLPEAALATLHVLSCLGSTAELESLAVAAGRSAQDVVATLHPALAAGLITRTDRCFAFTHDRVQEAAYALRPADVRSALHLRIGMALADHFIDRSSGEELYFIVDQLNRGIAALASESERSRIVSLNLTASRRARNAAAYNNAIVYLDIAQTLLGPDARSDRSAIARAVELYRAECEFLVGRLDVAEAKLLSLSRHCVDLPTRAHVTSLLANLYTIQGHLDRGVEVCLDFLRDQGFDWDPHPGDAEADEQGNHLRQLAGAMSAEDLRALPPMIDPDHRATMAVFADLIPPAGLTDHKLSHTVLLAAARFTLQHGICDELSYPLVCVFDVLDFRYAATDIGLRLARFGAALAEQRPHSGFSGRALMVFGHLVSPWVQPIETGQPILRRAIEIAMATGDLAFVAYTYRGLVSARLFRGESLPRVLEHTEEGLRFADESGFQLPADALLVQKEFALGLTGRDGRGAFDELARLVDHPLEDTRPIIAFFHYAAQIQTNVVAERYDAALFFAERAERLSWVVRAYPELIEFRFYAGLAHAAACDAKPTRNRKMQIERLRRHHQELVARSAVFSDNFASRIALLSAELARVEGRYLEAERLYEDAVNLARNGGYVQVEAIASERAARSYGVRRIRTVAYSYLANARLCYLRWGADAKVRQLDRSNPHLSVPEPGPAPAASFEVPLNQLDVRALFKASRALSGEIVFDALIRRLMEIVLQEAAAERGVLFLNKEAGPVAVAEARLGARGIEVTVSEGKSRELDFSRGIVNYVTRTRTSINSAENLEEGLFWLDSYLQRRPHIHAHCLPIVTQSKLLGMLYLESPVAAGSFTPQRIAVLELLASQAAISLENTRLYAELRRSEAFLAEGQRMSHSGSWSWDALTGDLFWSEEHCRIFGMDPVREKSPTLSQAFRAIHWADRAELRRTVQSLVRCRLAFTCECRLVHRDGVRHVQVVGRPEVDEAGNLKSYVGTTIDMSDIRRTHEALQSAQSDLARATRLAAIGELTSLIAHEVRQPLTAMASQAGACRSWLSHIPPEIGQAMSAAARISEDAHRANRIIESIREMTKKSLPARTVVDVNDMVEETLVLLRSELRRQRVVLKTRFADGLGPVLADRVQLQQVVMNLVMNGAEAMATIEERSRLLSLSTEAAPTGEALVSVADVGVGLAPDAMARLFEAFFTTKPNGVGVGLSICRSIIDSHGGTISVSHNHPHGSVFEFTLPVQTPAG